MNKRFCYIIGCFGLLMIAFTPQSHAQLSNIDPGQYHASWWNRAPTAWCRPTCAKLMPPWTPMPKDKLNLIYSGIWRNSFDVRNIKS